MRSYFSIIDFNSWENTVLLIKLFSIPLSYKVLPMFSFISFSVWGFTLRSLIYLELILCRMVDMVFISLFYIWTSNFPNIICWKWCVFPPVYIFSIFAISEDSNYIHSCLSVLLCSMGLHVWVFFFAITMLFFLYYFSSVYSLKSVMAIPPTLILLLRIALAMQGPLLLP